MIAPVAPGAPRGSSAGEDASGFRSILAALLSPDGEDGAVSHDGRTTQPAQADDKAADGDSGPLVLPGAVEVKAPEPQVLPGSTPVKDAEALVLPGAAETKDGEPHVLPGEVDAKAPEPQVLRGATPTKDAEPLVLPGAAVETKAPEPQVLPGATPTKDAEPLVLPDVMAPKGLGRQILPGASDSKAPRPQILPGTDPADGAPPAPGGGDVMETAESGSAGGPARPGTGLGHAPSLQPPPPPLKALAERTSKPLDETQTAPTSTPAAAKATGATGSAPSAPADQAAKPAPPTASTPVAPQADSSVPAQDEGHSSGGPTTAQSEAAAPARDHSLSTLSRASIDATAQIAAQIQRRLEGRSTRFEIALRPAELGRVDVKLDIDSEGRLAARLAFDNPAAATDMRGRVDELRRQLEAAGFHLAEDAFEFADRDSGSSAFDRGQDARHGQDRAFAAAARLKSEVDVAQPPQWLALSLSPSGVDMKV